VYGLAIGQAMTRLLVLSAVMTIAGAGVGFLAGRAVSPPYGDESEKKATAAAARVFGAGIGVTMGLALFL